MNHTHTLTNKQKAHKINVGETYMIEEIPNPTMTITHTSLIDKLRN